MTDDLPALRARLDEVDGRMLDLVKERQDIIRRVALYKQRTGAPVRDALREADQLRRLTQAARERGVDPHLITQLMQRLVDHSVRFQEALLIQGEAAARHQVLVAYQGTAGSYSQMAAEQHFGPRDVDLTTRGYDSFAAILTAVVNGDADYAMLPMENTTAGSINEAYDLLARTDLVAVGEEVLRVQHCLVALPGTRLADVRRVYSHPQGLAQCATFLSQLQDCTAQAFTDTAMSVVKVRDDGDPAQAAVASDRAASLYGLSVLARDIADQKDNYTRFMVIGRSAIAYDSRIPCKTSLIFATSHSEGALVRCLSVLAKRGLNMTKLESRPRVGKPFEYAFYLDFEGNLQSDAVRGAVAELRQYTKFLKVLGSYPARTTHRARPELMAEGEPAPVLSVGVGMYQLGAGEPLLLAGPRVVRDRAQLADLSRLVRDCGAAMLYAPCFSPPRASGDCAGPGLAGVPWVAELSRQVDLPVVTNAAVAADVREVCRVAGMIEVLGEQMHDFSLLSQVGRVDVPVLLRRGPDMNDEAFLAAAEHVRRMGNQQLVLCQVLPHHMLKDPQPAALAALVANVRAHETAPLCFAITAGEADAPQLAGVVRSCLAAGAHSVLVALDTTAQSGAAQRLLAAAAAGFAPE